MENAHRRDLRFLRHFDTDSVGAHGLDMRRPLLDESDIKAGSQKIGTDRGSVCPGAHDRYAFVGHSFVPFSQCLRRTLPAIAAATTANWLLLAARLLPAFGILE
jgi:hypothetical protein